MVNWGVHCTVMSRGPGVFMKILSKLTLQLLLIEESDIHQLI